MKWVKEAAASDRFFKDKYVESVVKLTPEELKLFEKEEESIYYDISGGHNSGDYANIIIDYPIDEEEIKESLPFGYEYGNEMDRWNEWGTGTFDRKTKKFDYD